MRYRFSGFLPGTVALHLLVLLFMTGLAAGCTPKAEIAATVGNTEITEAALAARLAAYDAEYALATLPETVTRETIRRLLLEELIDEQVVLTAAHSRGLINEKETDARRVGKLLFSALGREVPYPSTAEARSYFAARRKHYHQPVRYETIHLLLADQHQAWEVKEMLERQGITMAAAADRFSIAGEAPAGGRLEPMALGDFLPEISVRLGRLKPGEITPVINTPFGYHLVRLEQRHPEGVPPFTEIENTVKDDLYAERLRQHFSAWQAAARQQAVVKYREPVHPDSTS
ncbi:MAG: peptidyl-prolyl cis-trans isomerase [Deltaproteobacteria bacterium]|nr:peptidyl-prolyl cis-trans isomerase [Candidatus Anaeroferrophillacea bacterium]